MELLIIDSIRKKLDESNNLYLEKNKKYYRDVLDFMNLLFEDKSLKLSSIKFNKITINENIFIFYNEIIKKYELQKPLFDLDNFDIEDIEDKCDKNEIKEIFYELAIRFSNNLLEKLNYKLKKKINKLNEKIKFFLIYNK